jgi:hypothetical protein
MLKTKIPKQVTFTPPSYQATITTKAQALTTTFDSHLNPEGEMSGVGCRSSIGSDGREVTGWREQGSVM